MILVLEIYQLFDDEVDLEGDNLSDKSKRLLVLEPSMYELLGNSF